MAIAFRSKGTTASTDTGVTSTTLPVAFPTGHSSGDLLLLFVTSDDNTNTTSDPTGWTRLFYITNGTSTSWPPVPRLRTKLYYRIDNGSLGSNLNLQFSNSAWPTGKPSVIAFMVAYTGCDTTGPIERWDFVSTTSTAAAQAHPQETTSTANAWLLTFRAISSNSDPTTFTCSVGTDVERQDDNDTLDELACALYDSNAALTAGLQTQRTTTASNTVDYGGLAASIVIKPAPPANAVTPSPSTAEAVGTALNATVSAQNGTWDACGTGGLPNYTFAIDWQGDGKFADSTALGTTYATDAFGRTVSPGWGTADTGQTWTSNGGSASDFSVGSGVGQLSMGSVNASRIELLSSPSADMDIQCDYSTPVLATGGSHYVTLVARYTDLNNYYMVRSQMSASQVMTVSIRKRVGGAESQIASLGLTVTHAAGTMYTLRMRIIGSTIWGKLWTTGTAEPDWQVVGDDTDITVVGSVGVRGILDAANTNTLPVVFSYDNFRASRVQDNDKISNKIITDIQISYGRDQTRQLNPAAVGAASFSVINVDRQFSPDFVSSVLYGDLEPSRQATAYVTYGGNVYPLMYSRVDDYNIKADITDRTVDFTFLDGLDSLQNFKLSTGVYKSMRTGELIGIILDLAGWTGPRDLDLGATIVPFWWVEGVDALAAITDLIKSEGPPSVAYQAPDGTFVFRDRHHRLIRTESTGVQAVFNQQSLMDCTVSPPVTGDGTFDFTAPFAYQHGARDVINSVVFDVSERLEDAALSVVWSQDDQVPISNGQSLTIEISTTDPFLDAVTPVSGTDFVVSGAGVVNVTLSRDSGQSAILTMLAVGGAVNISGLRLRAKTIAVSRQIKVSRIDADSITQHGQRDYPDQAPWANVNDADAIAGMILLQYARRRPTVQLRIVTSDPAHLVQVLTRTVSDRIHLTYGEMGLDSDFFVESVQHTIQRINQSGKPPVHSVVLGCEKDVDVVGNPFTFDQRGAGFDDGVFDPMASDDPSTVFRFDDPIQGVFDYGKYGT